MGDRCFAILAELSVWSHKRSSCPRIIARSQVNMRFLFSWSNAEPAFLGNESSVAAIVLAVLLVTFPEEVNAGWLERAT